MWGYSQTEGRVDWEVRGEGEGQRQIEAGLEERWVIGRGKETETDRGGTRRERER